MLRCHNAVRCPKQGIAACCKHGEFLLCILDFEHDIGTLGFSNPVDLHFLGGGRPVAQLKILQQTFCIFCDFQYPLAHRLADNRETSTLTLAVDDLFIGKHGSQLRTPVDRNFIHIGKSLVIQLQKNPLCPLVVAWIRRGYFTIPVIGKAQRTNLFTEMIDIHLCELCRMISCCDGKLLCR